MMEWPNKENPESLPDWYKECFRAALLRMAVVVNIARRKHDRNYPLRPADLKLSALALFQKLDRSNLAPSLISFNLIQHDKGLSHDNEFLAENFFYARIGFKEETRPIRGTKKEFMRTRITYEVPETFVEWSYEQLQPPSASAEALEMEKFDEKEFVFECASNYLLKNFWHNFVHHQLQGINESNYRDFSGSARYDSDFEADNLATILLIKSYGLPIQTKGSAKENSSIRSVWQRNRCNLVFQERARHRHDDTQKMTQLERYQEAEWRFFRLICNRLSVELICKGLAVRSLRVFANGKVNKGRVGYYRSGPGKVIVELNSRRYYTRCPVYVPPEHYGAKRSTKKRRRNIRYFQESRVNDIVTIAVANYQDDVQRDESLRSYATNSLATLFDRLGLPA